MNSNETISEKIQMLTPTSQKEVLDFIEALLEKSAKSNQEERASAWDDWTKSHSENSVIVNDRREAIYEDE